LIVFEALQQELADRQAQGLSRRRRLLESAQGAHIRVDGRDVLSFCSNDYLGLANHPAVIAAIKQGADTSGAGSGASHLITGHHQLHHQLELSLAEFVRQPKALLFANGYMANMGVVAALLGREDAVFADKLNHASLNDAAVLSRSEFKRYAHNDLRQLEKLLAASKAKRKLVLTDVVFSMDGDIAPVPEILALCEKHDAWLMLDDAHGFGVLGAEGRGALQHFNLQSSRIIYMATLGKAAGVAGAFVAGDSTLIDYLVQHARTYIYTTATPPLLAAGLLTSLALIASESWRRERLLALISALRDGLANCRWQLQEASTPIQPLIVGSNEDAVKVSESLLQHNILVPAIRPPTVPRNTARLRISLSAAHTLDDVAMLVSALQETSRQ
jgi:8-amino-7-oxononanoate synthase